MIEVELYLKSKKKKAYTFKLKDDKQFDNLLKAINATADFIIRIESIAFNKSDFSYMRIVK